MESTGVYWKPVYAVLEGSFELVVANAHHIKNVPGRKTDVKDAEWIADLLRHGLIRNSFVPPKPLRELRDLMLYRTKLVQSRTAERNRLLKLLETAHIKLASFLSDVFGVSGLAMVKALVKGELSVGQMAHLARGRLRKKVVDIELALDGRVEEHHRYLLEIQLRRLEELDRDISMIEKRVLEKLEPYKESIGLLITIPGVDWASAAIIVSEMGTDMSVFPSERHLAAWAGVSPGNNETAGKRRSGHSRKGNAHLTTILVQSALSAARTKGTYLKNKFYRLKARRGHKRAAMAIAHKVLTSCYHMLLHRVPYKDLGETYLDRANESHVRKQLVKRFEKMGYNVILQPIEAAPTAP